MPQGLQRPDQVRAFIFVSYPKDYPTRISHATAGVDLSLPRRDALFRGVLRQPGAGAWRQERLRAGPRRPRLAPRQVAGLSQGQEEDDRAVRHGGGGRGGPGAAGAGHRARADRPRGQKAAQEAQDLGCAHARPPRPPARPPALRLPTFARPPHFAGAAELSESQETMELYQAALNRDLASRPSPLPVLRRAAPATPATLGLWVVQAVASPAAFPDPRLPLATMLRRIA